MEKVTSIVKSQTRTREQTEWVNEYYVDKNGKEQSYSYPRSYDVVEITDLAKRLYPPPKPQVKKFSGCLLILGIMGLCSGLLGGALVLLNIIIRNNYSDIGIELVGAAAGALFWLVVGILVFWAKNNQDKNEARRIAREKPLWEDAMRIWNRLYYCHRDDIVFDGDDIKNTCQPQDVIKFCYQPKRS